MNNVRVQVNTGLGRLTTTMSNFRVAEIDLTDLEFSLDFISEAKPSSEIQCEQDFDIAVKLSGVKMVFVFD